MVEEPINRMGSSPSIIILSRHLHNKYDFAAGLLFTIAIFLAVHDFLLFLARIWGCCETLRRLRPCNIPLFRPHGRFWPEYGDAAKHSSGLTPAASLFFGHMAVPSQNMGMLRNTPQASPLQHPSFSAA